MRCDDLMSLTQAHQKHIFEHLVTTRIDVNDQIQLLNAQYEFLSFQNKSKYLPNTQQYDTFLLKPVAEVLTITQVHYEILIS